MILRAQKILGGIGFKNDCWLGLGIQLHGKALAWDSELDPQLYKQNDC